ncbi:hypothetical protein DK842_06305 [Chromobacterium phragmitis]|uniref:DUF4234 domain-containing protein n=1 Tax=Chromobacterium phragmitis TaxID=2202141 RepID=A0A344UI27_9NEIS|nr:hypothetical protein [Chromobacterium phragmitis]AXE29547.1 hypothetical protein DK842_06305 [Chromobacterium phragmitis]AXE34925.1 hypothetical protein DK843_11825 [Chromobacterium phragmitis]
MAEDDILTLIAGMGIMAMLMIGILALIAQVFYFLTLHKTMDAVSEQNRPFTGALIWLGLIPLLGLVWWMVYILLLSTSIKKDLSARQIPGDGGFGITLALVILQGLCFIPYLNLLVFIPMIVLWIIHWTKMAALRKQLQPPQSFQFS